MNNILIHHGIKGQRWGVRRYQNEDGTLTAAGKKRQEIQDAKDVYDTAKKNYKSSMVKSLPVEGTLHPIKTSMGNSKFGDAYSDMIVAKAKYKSSKYDDITKKEKVEKSVYSKALAMAGQKWSQANIKNYGAGASLENRLKVEKGEAYVKSCKKSANTALISTVAAGTAVGIGLTAFGLYKAINFK